MKRYLPRPHLKRGYASSDEEGRENQAPDVVQVSASTLPPPIEPYRPEPKYTMDTIVTPNTIIPTCYFEILSVNYDAHEQAHYYDIKSLPQIGEQSKFRGLLEDGRDSPLCFVVTDSQCLVPNKHDG
jgi:hypothetical protein